MRRIIIAAAVSVALLIAFTGGPSPTSANPAAVWVLNLTVVNASSAAAGCTTPHNCDLSTRPDRAALLSNFGALQTQSGGKVEQEPSGFVGTPAAGFTDILVQTDGSSTPVVMNGRGLRCTPACDGVTTSTPNAIDHFVAYKITDTGTYSIGDTIVATAQQDSVTLDSRTIMVVGPPPPSVGGIAQQPDVTALSSALTAGDSKVGGGWRAGAGVTVMLLVAGACGWYVRRRRRCKRTQGTRWRQAAVRGFSDGGLPIHVPASDVSSSAGATRARAREAWPNTMWGGLK
jgi:hypothetical protein